MPDRKYHNLTDVEWVALFDEVDWRRECVETLCWAARDNTLNVSDRVDAVAILDRAIGEGVLDAKHIPDYGASGGAFPRFARDAYREMMLVAPDHRAQPQGIPASAERVSAVQQILAVMGRCSQPQAKAAPRPITDEN